MKKLKKNNKLEIKKVTLRNLDEPTMQGVAAAGPTIKSLCYGGSNCTAGPGVACC
jgi:hypothetical protein